MTEWRRLRKYLEGQKEVILLVHEKPDGDCLGSALALGQYIKGMGVAPVLLLTEPISEIYSFFPLQEIIEVKPPCRIPEGTVVIMVDCADLARVEYTVPSSCCVINIDHHISNKNYGTLNIVDTEAAAAGEIIYGLFQESGIKISPEIATLLFTAISTDTGSFSYSNTTSKTLRIASDLLALDIDLNLIRQHLYEKRPFAELEIVKIALGSLFLKNNGRIIGCILSYQDILKNNLFSVDTDGLLGMMRATEGVEVVLLFKELNPGEIKVSIRSKCYVDVNKLAQEFGGGGHYHAAGCTIKEDLKKVVKDILLRLEYYIESGISHERSY